MLQIQRNEAFAQTRLAVEQDFDGGTSVLLGHAHHLFDVQGDGSRAGKVPGLAFNDVFADEIIGASGDELTRAAGDEFTHKMVDG